LGAEIDYKSFLNKFDKKLERYFNQYKEYIFCKPFCSSCCEKGDYPLSELELRYLMQGYAKLDSKTKIAIQENLQTIKKGAQCPFLINKLCAVYEFRPIICRVHGLAYFCKDKLVKLPYCVNFGKNYSEAYSDGKISLEPISENLDTQSVLSEFEFGEMRNLYDWINKKE
jgi:Fe-S-cluster containining protein